MDISRNTLDALYTGFNARFRAGLGLNASALLWSRIATEVPSTTEKETYPWLGDMPGMREWVGDRQLKEFGMRDYTVVNRLFEQSVRVKRTKIEDDTFGIYSPMFTALGEAAARWPDQVVFEALRAGFATNCYDGQFYFDTDHPVYDAGGNQSGTVSNMQAGAGEPWVLMNTRAPLKPMLWQLRLAPTRLVRLDKEDDDKAFMRDEFIYGSRARGAAGYGFWQMAFGSKAALTAANFKAARQAMRSVKDERGEPVVNEPDLLLVGTANADLAEDLFKKEFLSGGETNTLRGAITVLPTPLLY